MNHLIITGNPVDGLRFVGPFDGAEEANHYADLELAGDDWWVAGLEDVPSAEVIRIVFTIEDVKGIAADNDVDFDTATNRALQWSKHITDTASGLCSTQLESVILTDQP